MIDGLIIGLAVLGTILTGRSLLGLFDRVCGTRDVSRPWEEIWGLSTLLGAPFTAASAFVWSDMGRTLAAPFSWRQVVIGGALGIVATALSPNQNGGSETDSGTRRSGTMVRGMQLIVVAVLAAVTVSTLVRQGQLGPERPNIEYKVKAIYEAQTIDAPSLIVAPAARDPLLLPLMERHLLALRGGRADAAGRIWSPMIWGGLLIYCAGVVARRTSSVRGWLLATILALLPTWHSVTFGIATAQSDAPAACFRIAAILGLWDTCQETTARRRVRSLLLASGMAASACFLKHEANALMLVDALVWSLVVAVAIRPTVPDAGSPGRAAGAPRLLLGGAVYLVFAVVLLIPWMRYRAQFPSTSLLQEIPWVSPEQLAEAWSRSPVTAAAFRFFTRTYGGELLLIAAFVLIGVLRALHRSGGGGSPIVLLSLLGTAATGMGLDVLVGDEAFPVLTGSLTTLLPLAVIYVLTETTTPAPNHPATI